MTREEAIKVLKINKPTGIIFEDNDTQNRMADLCKALEMAIQALSQEPCDDAVSREAVEQMIKAEMPERGAWEIGNNKGDVEKQTVCEVCVDLLQSLNDLPSVTQKSGKWIPVSERLPEEYGEYLITWKNPKYPKIYIGICECEITDVYDHEHNRFEVEWLFDGYITNAYPDSYVIAWQPLPKPYEPQESEDKE